MKNTEIFDQDLNPVLESASDDDLGPIVDYIKTKAFETLTVNSTAQMGLIAFARQL